MLKRVDRRTSVAGGVGSSSGGRTSKWRGTRRVVHEKVDNGAPVEVNGGGALTWGMSLGKVQVFLHLIWECSTDGMYDFWSLKHPRH
jgi:hypothetical protein